MLNILELQAKLARRKIYLDQLKSVKKFISEAESNLASACNIKLCFSIDDNGVDNNQITNIKAKLEQLEKVLNNSIYATRNEIQIIEEKIKSAQV